MEEKEINSLALAEERTLLASERTFSAWLRTALAAIAGGIAIVRFVSFKTDMHRIIGHIAGDGLILWGCLLIIMASLDYKRAHRRLTVAKSYKSSWLGFIMIIVPLLIVSALLIWVNLL